MMGMEKEGSVKKIHASLREKIADQIKGKGVFPHGRL
jgi:hypothetical protein